MKDYLVTLGVIILLVTSMVSISSGEQARTESSSLAPHQEFPEPDEIDRQNFSSDIELLTIKYQYEMNYDIVPEDLIFILKGAYDPAQSAQREIAIERPDGRQIILKSNPLESDGDMDFSYRLHSTIDSRESIYHFGKQFESGEYPGKHEVDPSKVIFGKADEDILSDPDPLKGMYEIKVAISGKDIEVNFGEEKSNLIIISKKPSHPRNLECNYVNGKVELDWDKPEDVGGSDIVQYNIYRATPLYSYKYLGNVSVDKTKYTDSLDGGYIWESRKDDRENTLLYYKVIAVNKENPHFYMFGLDWEDQWANDYDLMSSSKTDITHVSPGEKKCDMSYKWVVNYGSLDEEYLKERVEMDSVTIHSMKGGDVLFYDINKVGEEDNRREYEYQGGFISQGEADMDLSAAESGNAELDIQVGKSWCDFSGKLWAEPVYEDEYEGLKVVKQTIEAEGKVNASIDNTFNLDTSAGNTHWEVSKDVDIEWSINLEIDYNSNNSWVLSKEHPTMVSSQIRFDYSGDLDAEVDLNLEDNKDFYERDVEEEINEELDEEHYGYGAVSARSQRRTFSPLIGSANFGYYITIDRALPLNESKSEMPLLSNLFSNNCQRDGFSMDKLYTRQYLDPMVLPGLGSFLGVGLKRANATNCQDEIETKVTQKINSIIKSKYFDSAEERKQWIEENEPRIREEIWGDILTQDLWSVDQQRGPSGGEPVFHGALALQPLGYFSSQPLDEDEVKDYNEDREEFLKNQLAEESEQENKGPEWLLILVPLIIVIVLIVGLVYWKSKKKERAERGPPVRDERTGEYQEPGSREKSQSWNQETAQDSPPSGKDNI